VVIFLIAGHIFERRFAVDVQVSGNEGYQESTLVQLFFSPVEGWDRLYHKEED